MLSRLILPVIIIVAPLLTSCGGAAPAPAPAPVPSAIDADGLYTTNCAVCHGKNREGISELGPALNPDSVAALNDTEAREIILNGKPNTAMAPFKGTLSSEEIDALVQLIKNASP